ncbi:MAG: TIGR03936 family radical SAM-associated protein [Cetobacterium sp.]|uniref:TIGR03936 family radical SAM-associated protein n=1 Tax=unclassified Cetobacterium TaxID=2630983 RepID=UPI00163CDF2B|nr:TIGR03936 family radical SAM-associated protein [Cetobacterium sp. 2A]MBC2856588.1 DUF2344 domain-containing protein [Cetobacterium sp. 2A]
MKKRVYFDKYGEMRFISHLDMLRFMERLIKKTHIPVKYSQGFHPRPRTSFGNPVSLGTEAYNEVMDIELEKNMSDQEIMDMLNSGGVIGFRVNKVETITDKISITDIFTNAIYEIDGDEKTIDTLENLFKSDNIIEVKEKNGKRTERNLGERVISFERTGNKIEVELVNTSPNSFLILAGIDVKDVVIKKNGYKK